MGVFYAVIFAETQADAPLDIVSENPWAVPLGIVVFLAVVLGFYAWTRREANEALAA
jgi:uncharacterized integral membrane protein